jgi:hypothetical protein
VKLSCCLLRDLVGFELEYSYEGFNPKLANFFGNCGEHEAGLVLDLYGK